MMRDGNCPGGSFAILQGIFLIQELNVERLRKVCTEVMGRARLQGAFIPHHRLDGGGDLRTGESFRFALSSLKTGIAASSRQKRS